MDASYLEKSASSCLIHCWLNCWKASLPFDFNKVKLQNQPTMLAQLAQN